MARIKDIARMAFLAGNKFLVDSVDEEEFDTWWTSAGIIESNDWVSQRHAELVEANRLIDDELHRLHKMIHKLRTECVSDMSDGEMDDVAGVEPQCAACHGFGPDSGQAPIPVELAVHDTTHAELLTRDKLAQVDKALRSVGLKLLYKVEEES